MQCHLLFNTKLEEFTSKDWVSKDLVSDFKKNILVIYFVLRSRENVKTERIVTMADIGFKIKDKRSKWKKLNQFTFIVLNSKVRPQMSLEGSNSLIKGSGANQEENYVKKK